MRRLPLALAALPFVLTACLSSAPAVTVRYYQLPPVEVAVTEAPAPVQVGLGDVKAESLVRDALAWRLSPVELTYDDTALWAQPPTVLVRNQCHDWLEARGRLHPNATAALPFVQLRLLRFEGSLDASPLARVVLLAELWRSGQETVRRRFDVGTALPSRSGEGLAIAMGEALDVAFADLEDWLVALLD